MVLLSLEDPQDVTLCGGGKRARDRTHLAARSIQAREQRKTGVRTVAMGPEPTSMLGDIYIGITGEPSTITKCGGGEGDKP